MGASESLKIPNVARAEERVLRAWAFPEIPKEGVPEERVKERKAAECQE